MKKQTNIRVFDDTRRRFKAKAAKEGKTLMQYLDELSRAKL